MDEPSLNGVTLREYIELLIRAETNEIRVIMAERLQAVQTAYEQHGGDHKHHEGVHQVIEREMAHLNELRTDVVQDRALLTPLTTYNTFRDSMIEWSKLMGNQFSTIRGQMVGAGFVLGLVFAGIQIAIAVSTK